MTIQRAKYKGWAKLQYQMITQYQMCYMSLSFNLLSIGHCLFTKKEVVVLKKDDDQVIFKGFRYNNLYLVDFTSEYANLKTYLFTKNNTWVAMA